MLARYPFVDVELARRLERAEATSSARFVAARARLFPESGAEWTDVAGTFAMFDGATSQMTQTFGLGMFGTIGDGELDRIEAFFGARGAATSHEVSPLGGATLLGRLCERGYRPIELTSVMYRPIAASLQLDAARNEAIRVRVVDRNAPDDLDSWAAAAAEGWSEHGDFRELMEVVSRISAARDDFPSFLAELDGRAIATGAMNVVGDVVLLAGASTIPSARRQGAQLALLEARLRHGAARGGEIAMMCAEPGSPSQRNAERHGFRIAYTRVKWQLGAPNPPA